jgi:hypothetical protein
MTGATVVFIRDLPAYPSSLWKLTYHLRGAGALDTEAGAETNDTYLITFVAETDETTPAPLPVGRYYYQAYVTDLSNATDKRLVDNGSIEVLPDLSDSNITTYDGRSAAELMVAAIDAVLAGKALRGDQASYTIGQRTLMRIPPDQLLIWRRTYSSIVEGERMQARIAAGVSPFETIAVEFVSPR